MKPADQHGPASTATPRYRKTRRGVYRPRIPIFWWVHKWVHARFVMRELTSLAVAFYAVVLLLHLWYISRGAEAYGCFQDLLAHPVSVGMHVIALLLAIFHSVTWFNLAPKAMVLKFRGRRVPGSAIIGVNFVGWIVVTAGIAWLLLT